MSHIAGTQNSPELLDLAFDFLIGVHVLGQRHHPALHVMPAGETGTAERERLVPVAPGVVAEVVLPLHHVVVHILCDQRTPVEE